MDFAADAVLSTIPPPRSAAARPAPGAEGAASFGDHLAAAEMDSNEAPAPADAEEVEAEGPPAEDIANCEIAAQPATAPTPAPLLMQLAVSAPAEAAADMSATGESAAVDVAPALTPAETAAQNATPSEREAKSKAAQADITPAAKLVTDTKAIEPASTPQTQPAQTAPAAASQAAPAQFNPVVAAAITAINAVTQQSTAQQRLTRAAATAKSASAQQTQAAPSAPQQQQPQSVKPAPAKSAADRLQAALRPAPTIAPQTSSIETPSHGASTHAIATHASSHSSEASAEQAIARAAPAALQVAREIVRRFDGGSTRFELRLDPPELGRVEVRLEVSRDHRVTAVIAADNPQSLMELSRHARELEQQLQSAGLALSENGLSFDLRQGARGDDGETSESAGVGGVREADIEEQSTLARPIGLERWRGVRVDLMV